MSSINPSQGSSSAPAATQFGVNLPQSDGATGAQPVPRVHEPLAFRGLSSSISNLNIIRTPFDPLPVLPSQDVQTPSCVTNNLSEPQPCTRVSSPSLRHASSWSPLDGSHFSPETLTPSTSNETSPSSGSADPAQHLMPSTSCPISGHRSSSNYDHPSHSPRFRPQSRSSRQSYSGDTLVDQSEPPSSLGSAVLLEGSTRLAQRFYQAYRYELLHRFLLALRALSQSLPIDGIPIHQWPEATQGIFVFLDFADARAMNTLSYFRSSVVALTPGLMVNSSIGDNNTAPLGILRTRIAPSQQDYQTATQRATDSLIGTRPNLNDPWAPGISAQRQRQAMNRSSEVYARMTAYGLTSEVRQESYMSVGVSSRRLPARRLLSSETGTSRIVPQELFGRRPEVRPLAMAEISNYQTRPVSWPGVLHRPLDRPPNFPANGTSRFQQPSDTGRWHGSPPTRSTYPPRATYVPTVARPGMGGPANYAYLPRNSPRPVNAASMGRIDFGHGPDFTMPRPASGQAGRAAQRMARSESLRGRCIARGRGTGHGRYYR